MVNTNSRPRLPVLGVFLSVCLIAQGTGSDGHNALGISRSGHYVTYKGEVLMLIGDSGTQCASQNSNLDHRQWIDDCARRGIRAIHLWSFVPVRQKQDGSQIEERWGYDPYVPGGDKGTYKRDWLGHASEFFNNCLDNLDAMAPHNELSSSGSYCLADPGREYVVYSMIGSPATVSVNLSATTGRTIDCRFYNPADGQFEPVFRRTGGSSHESFAKLDERDWVLHIVAK